MLSLPLIIAHRGASAAAPENTLVAFALAHQQGADMLELDVRRAGAGGLVVFHDATTARLLPDVPAQPLHQLSVADLRLLRPIYPVPTLAEVCAYARAAGIALNIELKERGLVVDMARLVQLHGLTEQVIISTFDPVVLAELRRDAPQLPRGYIMGAVNRHTPSSIRAIWPFFALKQTAATAWHPYHSLPLLPRILPLVRQAGYAVNVWTVNSVARMRTVATWGVTGIITDRPDRARKLFPR